MLRLLFGILVVAWLWFSLGYKADAQTLQLDRWNSATVLPQHKGSADAIAARVIANRSRYEVVSKETGVPWFVIAGLHNMEASGSFTKHLHEGSPLSGRTRWVPKGRPTTGRPPFKWEVSAVDALRLYVASRRRGGSIPPSQQSRSTRAATLMLLPVMSSQLRLDRPARSASPHVV